MKIAVLVSGGVDSSVALRLLHDAGHEVTAFYLKIWLEDELSYLGDCPWEDDLAYARKVCEQVDVPLEVVSLQKEYWDRVVSYTLDEVKKGRTPNPDMMCNARVKFGAFYDKIDDSFEKVATGHYAQVETASVGASYMTPQRMRLMRSKDSVKDQTYFLAHLSQDQLQRAMFPIGHLIKDEVRALAKKYDLPNQARKDSQGICFLGNIDYKEFIRHHLGKKKGDIIEFESNKKLAQHDGFWFYTKGQRHGLGLSGGPWYVVEKDVDQNIVYVSNHYHEEDKHRDTIKVEDVHLIDPAMKVADLLEVEGLRVKVRHGEHDYAVQILSLQDSPLDKGGLGGIRNPLAVKIDGNDQGLAAGQFAVFYDGEVCLGSGVIA
jgi:tRNA (5-methylaminomethyl-2-thiouridylate)-methyltransferase